MGIDEEHGFFDTWQKVALPNESTVSQIACGNYFSVLVMQGKAYSCGNNSCGVLGHDYFIDKCNTFRQVFLPAGSIKQVACGPNYVIFLTRLLNKY